MVESHKIDDASADNERSLNTLARTIRLSQGRFSLILVRCNYPALREEMRQRLHEKSTVEIQELILPSSSKRLYDEIADSIKAQPPKALMVLGLESVAAIDELLAGANRDRDKFKRDFAFPLVLWMTDRVLHIMGKSAPDFNTWSSPPIKFIPDPDFLINFQQETIEKAFGDDANFTINEAALEAVQQDLQQYEQELDPGLQACWEFIRGRIDARNNQLDSAIEYYQKSLGFWQQSQHLERQGILLLHLGLAYNRKAEQRRTENRRCWEIAKDYLQQSLVKFQQAQRPELVAKHISQLGEVLRNLQDWQGLKDLANTSLSLHQQYGNANQIAQDYGFLAEVALEQSRYNEANQLARNALEELSKIPNSSTQEQGLYHWLLARSQRHLEQITAAIENLETARNECQPQFDPQQYIRILEELRELYFNQGQYKQAFELKLEQREIKSKYRLQAFIGAGRLQPETGFFQDKTAAEIVEEIVAASGRQQDIKRLIERIEKPAYKLTVIYGQSGVGKSSILQAGLVPTLQFIPFEMGDALPILVQAYHDWARDCGQGLSAGLKEVKNLTLSAAIDTPTAILEQLRNNEQRHLLTVLIFDQFEEFFFVYQDPASRLPFYDFLSECLKITDVKVILSLREDYIYYLLECNRRENLSIIDNDILSKNILYYLGNFSRSDAKTVIQTLTERAQLDFHDDLVEGLVEDLAGKLGEVRPIELQVVGAQLEKRQIATLIEYQKLGERAKEKLVEEYLAEVVKDCGRENQETAQLVLYLLTDENNTRPQKTQAELAPSLAADLSQLELVLEIFVKSGLVLLVPASPSDRYQLVHDYLVPFIRKQQGAELLKLRAKLQQTEAENKVLAEARQKAEQLSIAAQRKANRRIGIGTAVLSVSLLLAATVMGVAWQQVSKAQQLAKLERLGTDTLRQFQVNNEQIEALISAVENGKQLQDIEGNKPSLADYSVSSPLLALQQIVDNIRERNQLKGHQDAVNSVSFSPDGKTIATASSDQTARLWDVKGKLLQEFKGHQSRVNSVSFSPDGKTIATASWDTTARLWDVKGKLLHELKGHQNVVTSVSFSPDGKTIATASSDKTARLWNLNSKLLHELKGHQSEVWSVSFSPDGKTIATASWDTTARLWDINGKLLHELKGHQGVVRSVSFSPDGKTISTASNDKTARLWDVKGKPLQEFKGHQDEVISVSFSPDGKTISTASLDRTARLWNLNDNLIKELGHQDEVIGISFSPDGKTIATASWDGTARLWDINGKLLQELKGHQSVVNSISFSPDGKTIATASGDNTARLWNLNGKPIKELKGHQSVVTSVSFSPDGKTIATASLDTTARLWDINGKLLQELKGHQDRVTSVSFSPDGKTIATASWDGTARLWNLNGKPIKELKGYQSEVWSVSFSPDGKTVATASRDKTARLWDINGKLLQELKGHRGGVRSVSFSPDGKTIATASWDGTARLSRIESLDEMLVRGCNWLRDYLENSADESEKHVCDRIGN